MKKSVIVISFLILGILFASPVSASAETKAGIKPGSFFYFFDTTFEKIGLFFTFSPEKKAEKALEYANERLAEVQAIEEEKNPDAIKTAITNYENNVTLATEKSKEVKDKGQAENLLNLIADNTSKNQEVLSAVLIKVPEEAKEAITRAIEASRKNQEEATRQIAELKGEVEQLKQEVAELKTQNDEQEKVIEEVSKQKTETSSKPTLAPASIKPTTSQNSGTTTTPKPTSTLSQTQTQTNEMQNTQPIIQPSANTTNTAPTPTTQIQTLTTIEISSVNIIPSLISVRIEWQTNIPTNSKIFLSGGNLSSKVYNSESGLSTRHIVNATGLTSGTTYSYEIESITGGQVAKKEGSFITKPDEYTISIQPDKTSVPASGFNGILFKVSTIKNGQNQTNQIISVVTPDTAQNKTFSDSFTYYPKTVGNHTLVFSWNGVSKSIDIQATTYIEIPRFVANISFDKDTVANDGVDSIKVTIITKDSTGAILPNKAVQVQTDKTQNFVSDANGVIKTTITTTGTAGSHSLTVRTEGDSNSDAYLNSKNYQVISVRATLAFHPTFALEVEAPAINEPLMVLYFDNAFLDIKQLKIEKIAFKLEGLTPDWITNIKLTKNVAADDMNSISPIILPSTYTFGVDGSVSVMPSSSIEIYYNDRLTVVADIKNNSSQKNGTGVKILEYAVIIDGNSFEFSGLVNDRLGIITSGLTGIVLPSRRTNWVITNYCISSSPPTYGQIVTCFDL